MNRTIFLSMFLAAATFAAGCSNGPSDEELLSEMPESDGKADSDIPGTPNQYGEIIRPDEKEVFAALARKINELQDLQSKDNGGHVMRGFHAKVHACMRAELRLDPARPAETRYGIFADTAPEKYAAWLRLSNGQGVQKGDNERDVRGWALKVLDVPGKKLLADEESAPQSDRDADTQDFNMTNRQASHVDDAVQFMNFADAAAHGDLVWWALKHPISAGRLLGPTKPVPSLVTTRYWTGSPYRLGPNVVKVSASPCAGVVAGTQGASTDDRDYLKKDLTARLKGNELCYDLSVQLRKHPSQEPIEKGSTVWDEGVDPFVKVAQIIVPQQDLGSEDAATDAQYCNDLSFSPWHGLPEHQPLGHMNRARKPVYAASAQHRGRIDEPKSDKAQ
jgi:hypothetical protein